MKVRIKVQPTGYISLAGGPLQEWPKVGEVVDLPEGVARALVAAGNAEAVRIVAKAETVETRPAAAGDVEVRKIAPTQTQTARKSE